MARISDLVRIRIPSSSDVFLVSDGELSKKITFADLKTSISPLVASRTIPGLVKIGDGLTVTDEGLLTVANFSNYSLPAATENQLGGVRVGPGLAIENGILSTTYVLPTATPTVLGGVKIGSGINISNGVISVATDYSAYDNRGIRIKTSDGDDELKVFVDPTNYSVIRSERSGKLVLQVINDSVQLLSPAQSKLLGGAEQPSFVPESASTNLGIPSKQWNIVYADTVVSKFKGTITNDAAGASTVELMRGTMATNDQFRILIGGVGTDHGYVELATSDNGTEPIYVRQYSGPGAFGGIPRTATLLDSSGNTTFPETLTARIIKKQGGLSSQFLKADGTVDSSVYAYSNGSNASGAWDINIDGSSTECTGNAASAAILQTARAINGILFNGSQDITIKASTKEQLIRGNYLIGNNFDGSSVATWAVNASTSNSPGKVVARDDSGNFSAGIITADLNGNSATSSKWNAVRKISITGDASWYVDVDGTGSVTNILSLAKTGVTVGTYRSVTVDDKGRVTAGTNPTTIAGYGITDATPSSHVGSSGVGVHAEVTDKVAGFMTATDKVKLDGIENNANNYTLPTASSSVLGGVKIGAGIAISNGVISYTLPTATTTALGGVMIGTGMTISDGKLSYILPTASSSVLGGVKAGNTVAISDAGVLDVKDAPKLAGYSISSLNDRWGVIPVVTSDGVMEVGRYIDFHNADSSSDDFAVRLQTNNTTSNLFINGNKIWHSGNHGSGSGLDADTVDGLNVHTGRNNSANQIVRTDSNGYLQVGYINSSDGNEGNNTSPPRIWGTNGNDSYLRTYLTSALSVGYAAKAGDSDTVDGYHVNDLVTRESQTKDDITIRTQSGAWQTSSATVDEGWPQTSNSWYHLLAATHSNVTNYYSMQFAGNFYNSNDIYYRSTNGSGSTKWNKLWHAGNDGTGSGLDADTLDGVQASDFALKTEIANLTPSAPIGTISFFAMRTPPNGWLECNGATLSRDDYPQLFQSIGYAHGGSGNSFKLPDLRGEFLRGWDNGRGVDPDRLFGSSQMSSFKAHDHKLTGVGVNGATSSSGSHSHTGSTSDAGLHNHAIADPGHTHGLKGNDRDSNSNQLTAPGLHRDDAERLAEDTGTITSSTTGITLNNGGSHSHTVSTSSDGGHTHAINLTLGGNTDSTGGSDTYPRNVAMIVCIKAISNPQNEILTNEEVLINIDAKVKKAGDNLTGTLYSSPTSGAIAVNTRGTPGFEVVTALNDTSSAAYMNFHRPGQYAVRFGLDTDNHLKVGGWSMGNNSYKIWHEGNDGTGSGLDADTLDGKQASDFLLKTDSAVGYDWFTQDVKSPGPNSFPEKQIRGFTAYGSTDFPGLFYAGLTITGEKRSGVNVFSGQIAFNWNNEESKPTGLYFRTNDDTGTTTEWSPWTQLATKDDVTGSNFTSNIEIRNQGPTLYLRDTDHLSAMVHVNSNLFYILRGSGADSNTWQSINHYWPAYWDLTTNNATFGGSIWAAGDVTAFSDEKLKENISTIDNAIDKVCALRGVYFNRKADVDKKRKIGLIAQEVQKVLPEVVDLHQDNEDKDGTLSVSYPNIVALLIEAVKEQQKQIDELTKMIKK